MTVYPLFCAGRYRFPGNMLYAWLPGSAKEEEEIVRGAERRLLLHIPPALLRLLLLRWRGAGG